MSATMPKKNAPPIDLDALAAQAVSDARTNPQEGLAVAVRLREIAVSVEQSAIRAALEHERWFEAPAAVLLGIPRQSMQRKMAPDLVEEARQRREAGGYTSGPRPKK